MAGQNAAEQFVDTLVRAGVQRLHGVVGDSLNPVVDAVRRTRGIEWIQVRHEEGATFAAGAGARLSGRLTACAGSSGPGDLHLVNGLYDAHRPMAPVLALASHRPSSEIGLGHFQKTHPDRLFRRCSHYCEPISDPRQMPRLLRTAIRHAVGRGGVGVVAPPGDVAAEPAPEKGTAHDPVTIRPAVRPGDPGIGALVRRVDAADRVTLFLMTDPNALSLPPGIRAGTVTGFALSASKIVSEEGGVGRMLRIARSSVRNVPRP